MQIAAWLYYAALVIYVVAWGTPVIERGVTLADGGLPGWQALVVALSPLLEWDASDGLVRALLQVASGLTNLVFVGLLVHLTPRTARPRPLAAGALLAAALVNGYWIWFAHEEAMRLRLGYFLWLGAFLCLAGSAVLPPTRVSPPAAPRG